MPCYSDQWVQNIGDSNMLHCGSYDWEKNTEFFVTFLLSGMLKMTSEEVRKYEGYVKRDIYVMSEVKRERKTEQNSVTLYLTGTE